MKRKRQAKTEEQNATAREKKQSRNEEKASGQN